MGRKQEKQLAAQRSIFKKPAKPLRVNSLGSVRQHPSRRSPTSSRTAHFRDGDAAVALAEIDKPAVHRPVGSSSGWRRLVGKRSSSIEVHLGPAVGAIFFNDYGLQQTRASITPKSDGARGAVPPGASRCLGPRAKLFCGARCDGPFGGVAQRFTTRFSSLELRLGSLAMAMTPLSG
jgi:hypothetical protein